MSLISPGRGGVRVPLRAKLAGGFVAVTLCGGLLAGVLVDRTVQRTTRGAFEERLSSEAMMLGQMTANALFGDLDPGDTSLREPVRALGEAVHTQLAVIARDGAVVADSSSEGTRVPASRASAPEVAAARTSGAGAALRDGRLYVARSIVRDGAVLGYASASVPMAEVERYVTDVRERIACGSALALLAAIALGLMLSSRIVRPVRQLSEGARRVGAGDFERAIVVSSRDEMGDLAGSFNEMQGSLRRTMQVLDGRNRDLRLVLDNVDQGLLTVDREGVVGTERSAALDRWLGVSRPGAHFWEALAGFDPKAAAAFELQWDQVLSGELPLEVVVDQLPRQATRGEQHIELSYTPLFADGALTGMLLVLTDVTARCEAERAEAEQREVAGMFEHMMRDRLGVLEFLRSTEALLRVLTGDARGPVVETRRSLHTLKGNAGVYGLHRLSALCHLVESHLADAGPEADLSVEDRDLLRASWAKLFERFAAFVGSSTQVVVDADEHAAVLVALESGTPRSRVARMIRDWRMERASDRLTRFAASARELGQRLDKGEIQVEVSSSTLRLPREGWAQFWGAFSHVVRNAVDHGLPSESEQSEGGAAPPVLRLSAARRGNEIVVEASDNGRGIDWDAVAARARRLGMPSARREDLVAALFADGVSTRDGATQVSGRGVGLAAVKAACEKMGGRVEVESEPGAGARFTFRVPVEERWSSLPAPRDSLRLACDA